MFVDHLSQMCVIGQKLSPIPLIFLFFKVKASNCSQNDLEASDLASVLTLSLHESDHPSLGPGHKLHHLATGAASRLGKLGLGQLKNKEN